MRLRLHFLSYCWGRQVKREQTCFCSSSRNYMNYSSLTCATDSRGANTKTRSVCALCLISASARQRPLFHRRNRSTSFDEFFAALRFGAPRVTIIIYHASSTAWNSIHRPLIFHTQKTAKQAAEFHTWLRRWETSSIICCLGEDASKSTLGNTDFWAKYLNTAYLLLLFAGAGVPPPAAAQCTRAIDKCFCTQNATETHTKQMLKQEN